MGLGTVKEKLHEYIDHADERQLQAMYMLLESELQAQGHTYDEATLTMLRETSENYRSGNIKGYPALGSLDRIKKQIKEREIKPIL